MRTTRSRSTTGPRRTVACRRGPWPSSGSGLSIGLCLAVTVGVGLLLDAVLHSSPAFLLVGLAVGIVVAVAMAVVTIRKYL